MDPRCIFLVFVAGFIVGPVYFKLVYPFLYHLPEMLLP